MYMYGLYCCMAVITVGPVVCIAVRLRVPVFSITAGASGTYNIFRVPHLDAWGLPCFT